MMEGNFRTRRINKYAGIFYIVLGLGFAAFMLFIDVMDSEATGSTSVGLISLAVVGVILAAIGLYTFRFNRNAYLRLDESGVSAGYGIAKRLECSYDAIELVGVHDGDLVLFMTDGSNRRIRNLNNIVEIYAELRRRVYKASNVRDNETLLSELQTTSRQKNKFLRITLVFMALMIVLLFAAIFIIGEDDMGEFSGKQWVEFTVFIVGELVICTFMFVFAFKCGALTNKFTIQCELYFKQFMETSPPQPGLLKRAFLSVDYMVRICVFGYYDSDDVYYTVETPNGNLPELIVVETSKVFSDISKLDFDMSELIELHDLPERTTEKV